MSNNSTDLKLRSPPVINKPEYINSAYIYVLVLKLQYEGDIIVEGENIMRI